MYFWHCMICGPSLLLWIIGEETVVERVGVCIGCALCVDRRKLTVFCVSLDIVFFAVAFLFVLFVHAVRLSLFY